MDGLRYLIPILALMIPIVAIVMKNWRDVQVRRMDLAESGGAALSEEAARRIARLEERIQVLERIATDDKLRLAREIDQL